MLNSVIWIIALTVMAVINLKTIINETCNAFDVWDDDFNLWTFILGVVATVCCCVAIYLHSAAICDYEKKPKVTTSTEPIVDTLKVSSGTYYLYQFNDNHYPGIK